MDSDETVKMVLFSILILIIGYLEYYNNKRIKDVKTQADNALTPSSLTVTAFRRDLDSIIKYVQSVADGSLVLKSGKDSQVERMRISPVGNIGIGTATISDGVSKFLVYDSGNLGITISGSPARYNMYVNSATANNKWWDVLATDGLQQFRVVNDAQNSATNYLQVARSGTTITNVCIAPYGGNVGIGTTSPASQLTISTGGAIDNANYGQAIQTIRPSANTSIHLAMVRQGQYTFGLGYIYNSNTFGIFQNPSATESSNTSPSFCMDTNGNVGIGTANPDYKLHVNGTAKVNSLLLSNSTRSTTSGLTSDGTHLYWNNTLLA